MSSTAKQLFKRAHRAARIDFYAVADFPGFGRAAQHAIASSRDIFVMRQRGEAASLMGRLNNYKVAKAWGF